MSSAPSDNPYAVGEAALALPPEAEAEPQAFYVVSPWKFCVLMAMTMGMYSIVWMFLHWSRIKRAMNGDQWPVMRAIFPVFFVHSLLERAASALRSRGEATLETSGLATLLVVLMIVGTLVDRASARDSAPLVLTYVSFALLFAQIAVQVRAQRLLNRAAGDDDGATNARFTLANWIWMVVFALIWMLMAYGLLIQAGVLPEAP